MDRTVFVMGVGATGAMFYCSFTVVVPVKWELELLYCDELHSQTEYLSGKSNISHWTAEK